MAEHVNLDQQNAVKNSPLALGTSVPLVSPLYQSSVYTLPDLDALDQIMDAGAPGYIYARDAHPNAQQLASRVAQIESAEWGIVTGSGMASLSGILLTLLSSGGRVVSSNRLYGKTTQLLRQELTRFGVHTSFVDITDLEQVRSALNEPTRLLLVETLSNPLLRLADIPRLAELAHAHQALFVVDNTFATPTLCRPLEYGADLVMESLTKMIGGHADVTLGAVCGRDPDRFLELTQIVSTWGFHANPFDAWLAERGLATLDIRMRTASANAHHLANWLQQQPGICRVVYPSLEGHPDRELALRLLGEHPGNMLCLELSGGREAVNTLLRRAPGIPFSPSLGNVTTTCSHPGTTSHRQVSPAEKARQGITDGLLRLSVGVEPLAQIQQELSRGLRTL